MKRILKAKWIATPSPLYPGQRAGVRGESPSGPSLAGPSPRPSPLITGERGQAVAIEHGRILAVDRADRLAQMFPDATVEDLGDVILLPGLVNAHTHLELSDCACGQPPTAGFGEWLAGMLRRTRMEPAEMERAVIHAIAKGVGQCVRFGVTSVGDISRQCRLTRRLLKDAPLRIVSFGEIQAMAQRRGLLEERLAAALDSSDAGASVRIGLTPHAPYSVEPAGYRRCLEAARAGGLPLATHLAETADEVEFLAEHGGPLRQLWDQWLTWDDQVPKFSGGPIRFARELGLLDYPTLLAHVNYCDDDELAILAAGRASVVWCPRTHRYFGHPPHRWPEMLAAGINVAVGTDSCASSPDLNLVDDLRLIHEQSPNVPAAEVWSLATVRAARALQSPEIGSLTPGKFADLVAFPVRAADPLREILEEPSLPTAVWLAGRQIL